MDISFDYTGTTSGYFGPTSQSSSLSYDTTTGQEFTETVTLTNSALLSSHSVTGISVASPFSLESISPSQFNPISPAGTVIYTLTITAPPTSGDYILSITVTTGSGDNDNTVAIQGLDLAIKYNNTNDDYFGPSTQSQTWYLNTSVGDIFSETITLNNYDELSSHSVSEISVASPSRSTLSLRLFQNRSRPAVRLHIHSQLPRHRLVVIICCPIRSRPELRR